MSLILTKIEYKEFFKRLPVISDAPVGADDDSFQFDRYVNPIISILTDPTQPTPFTIGIFGPWGSGKSSVLKILSEKLSEEPYNTQFVRVDFNPWIYRGEPNLLLPLLTTVRDTLEEDPSKRFAESAQKLTEILLRMGADILLKSLTAKAASLESLEKIEKSYLEEHAKSGPIVRKLRKLLSAEINAIAKAGAKLIIFIDDLDRCDPADIINLLESVKLFLDLENIFVVFALDREVVTRGIQIRYKGFDFNDARTAAIGAEYIEKMIQLPIELFPLDDSQIISFLDKVCPKDAGEKLQSTIKLLGPMVAPNPRRIKRLINSFAVIRSLVEQRKLDQLDLSLLLRLVVLQIQYPEIYSQIAGRLYLLTALEDCYQGRLSPNHANDFNDFPDPTEALLFCKNNCPPLRNLSSLFANSAFKAAKDSLTQYLTLLGDHNAKG